MTQVFDRVISPQVHLEKVDYETKLIFKQNVNKSKNKNKIIK